ncbi:MAG: UDP-N-acetylmuramoyl-L-alanyl-D-glutamate--2,6-diaminopimelate ligase, partial [Caldanaerobacter sp.]
EEGVKKTNCPYVVIEDRKEAIRYALLNAQKNDVIILAGKGHETYQVIGDKVIPFDEREIVKEILNELKK